MLFSVVYYGGGCRIYINSKNLFIYVKNDIRLGFIIAGILRYEFCSKGILSCVTHRISNSECIVGVIPNPYTVGVIRKLD